MQENLLQEAMAHFNEPILMGFNLCRLIGYSEDDEDCYMIVFDPRRGRYKNTFVGGYTYLDCLKQQGQVRSVSGEDWNDFTRLDSLLELNGAPKAPEFIVEVEGLKDINV